MVFWIYRFLISRQKNANYPSFFDFFFWGGGGRENTKNPPFFIFLGWGGPYKFSTHLLHFAKFGIDIMSSKDSSTGFVNIQHVTAWDHKLFGVQCNSAIVWSDRRYTAEDSSSTKFGAWWRKFLTPQLGVLPLRHPLFLLLCHKAKLWHFG